MLLRAGRNRRGSLSLAAGPLSTAVSRLTSVSSGPAIRRSVDPLHQPAAGERTAHTLAPVLLVVVPADHNCLVTVRPKSTEQGSVSISDTSRGYLQPLAARPS